MHAIKEIVNRLSGHPFGIYPLTIHDSHWNVLFIHFQGHLFALCCHLSPKKAKQIDRNMIWCQSLFEVCLAHWKWTGKVKIASSIEPTHNFQIRLWTNRKKQSSNRKPVLYAPVVTWSVWVNIGKKFWARLEWNCFWKVGDWRDREPKGVPLECSGGSPWVGEVVYIGWLFVLFYDCSDSEGLGSGEGLVSAGASAEAVAEVDAESDGAAAAASAWRAFLGR